MNKEIRYLGQTARPSDYDAPDGDLALSLNLINEDGAPGGIPSPPVIARVEDGHRLFLHKAAVSVNHIQYSPHSPVIKWTGQGTVPPLEIFDTPRTVAIPAEADESIISVRAVGYILVVSTRRATHYIRFRAEQNDYLYLGTSIPDIDISFSLRLNFESTVASDVQFEIGENSGLIENPGTPDDAWDNRLTHSYEFRGPDGDFSIGSSNTIVSRRELLDPLFKIEKNKEYRLRFSRKFDPANGAPLLTFYGKRNGGTAIEHICAYYPDFESSSLGTQVYSFPDEWTDISFEYSIRYPDPDFGSEGCKAIGEFFWDAGIETGDRTQGRYVKYTSEGVDAILAQLNLFVKMKSHDKSRFIYPFFLRYAVRLYDGSVGFVSNPILLVPNSGYAPYLRFGYDFRLKSQLSLVAFCADILYSINTPIPDEWGDVISAVDIYISAPFYTYDQGFSFDASGVAPISYDPGDVHGFGRLYYYDSPLESDASKAYGRHSLMECADRYADTGSISHGLVFAPVRQEKILDQIKSTALFYKVSSLQLNEINADGTYRTLLVEEGTLANLVTRPLLEDTLVPYRSFSNGYIQDFNNRLHISGPDVQLPPPALPALLVSHRSVPEEAPLVSMTAAYVEIHTDQGVRTVRAASFDRSRAFVGNWFFYPDMRAKSAIFVTYDFAGHKISLSSVRLTQHPTLNGAYWFSGNLDDFPDLDNEPDTPLPVVSDRLSQPSQIYVSEVSNPFVFKAASVISVPVSRVLAVSHSGQALSQGQFGQFPLYAFTSEGVWALEVAADATYTARQPVSRDVCVNPDGVTQTDSAVLFPTARGIMMISGSQTRCVSDPVDSGSLPVLPALPAIGTLLDKTGLGSMIPFSDFIAGASMIYDYTNQRIWLCNGSPDIRHAYVLSLKSGLWGMAVCDVAHGINSYPDAWAITADNSVVSLSDTSGPMPPALLVTRPVSLGMPDILKTVDSVIQRGSFAKGHVASALYGSRDLIHWHLVWSSKDHLMRGFRGTPYKYFRIALLCHLTQGESVSGATVSFTPRLTDRLR